ncbi:hypothetical protein CBR_g32529 [Chara braunii]|uniref:CCHC-type domain-containing protein n=1 Tax=Chara braunii TaxID=69332 RepID=A0A388LGT3_CHABU|nr:hypothetical protein CBR_g32529 [Chara braunii]|eukprot:GBG81540.1 hypothetical protein CBR_g32529 [Chara braunii]
MTGDGLTVTAILDYSYGRRELKLKINIEGGREEEMRVDPDLQMAITKAKDRVERRCVGDDMDMMMMMMMMMEDDIMIMVTTMTTMPTKDDIMMMVMTMRTTTTMMTTTMVMMMMMMMMMMMTMTAMTMMMMLMLMMLMVTMMMTVMTPFLGMSPFGRHTVTRLMRMLRSWDSIASMLPKGGEAIWGGVDWSPEEGHPAEYEEYIGDTYGELRSEEDNQSKSDDPHTGSVDVAANDKHALTCKNLDNPAAEHCDHEHAKAADTSSGDCEPGKGKILRLKKRWSTIGRIVAFGREEALKDLSKEDVQSIDMAGEAKIFLSDDDRQLFTTKLAEGKDPLALQKKLWVGLKDQEEITRRNTFWTELNIGADRRFLGRLTAGRGKSSPGHTNYSTLTTRRSFPWPGKQEGTSCSPDVGNLKIAQTMNGGRKWENSLSPYFAVEWGKWIGNCFRERIGSVPDLEIVRLALAAYEEKLVRDSWWTATSEESAESSQGGVSSEGEGSSKESSSNKEEVGQDSDTSEEGEYGKTGWGILGIRKGLTPCRSLGTTLATVELCLRERVLGWFDREGTAKTREGQNAGKEGPDTNMAGEASSSECGLRKIVSSLARALNKNQGYLADAKKKLTFDGANITEFLIDYENLDALLKWTEEEKMDHLGQHVPLSLGRDIMAIVAASRSWKETRDVMMRKYLAAEKMATEVDLAAVQRKNFAMYNDFLREFTLVALRIPGVTDRIMSKYFLRQFSEFDKDKILSAYQQTSKFVNTRNVDFSTVPEDSSNRKLALLKEGEVIDLTSRTGDKVKRGIESLHERVHGVGNKIERVENALLVMQAQVSRPALPPQEAVVPPGVANRGFGRRDLTNEQCKYCTAVGHFVRACPKLNHDILKRRCTRSLKGEIFGPQGERVNWNSPGGMRRAIIMLNRLEITAVEAEPVVDIIWDQLRGRRPQVNFIMESDGRDRVNASTRLGTAGRRIIRDTVMEEVAGSSEPQAEPEAEEPEKVYGKPREEKPTNKVTAAKKKFRYQIPILTMPEIDDTLSKLLGTMVSVSFQTMLQASPRLLKGLRQLMTRRDHQKGRLDAKLIPPVRIHTEEHECRNDKGPSYEFGIAGEVTDLLRAKMDSFVAEPTASRYANRWFVFWKPNKTLRWIQDLQKLNAVTIRDAGSLPQADLLAESHAGRSIYSLIDLYSGYDQLPLDVRDRPYTAMHTPVGQLQMQVTPMGFTNAVAEAQRRMLVVAGDMFPEKCEPYIDDNPIKGAQEKGRDGNPARNSKFKKEVPAILHCLKTFQAYLFGRRFILRIDLTNVAGALKNYRPIDPTAGRWVGFMWQFDYKIERIAGIRNKADGLSRVCITLEAVEEAEPIDAFLEYEGGTLAVDNEMMGEECASGELLIRTLEKGAPAVVAAQGRTGQAPGNKMARWLSPPVYSSGPEMPIEVRDGVSVVLPEEGTWTDLEPAYETVIMDEKGAFRWIETIWTKVSLTRLSPSLMDLEFRGTVEARGWVYLSQELENAMVMGLVLGTAPDQLFRQAEREVVWAACQRVEMEMERMEVRGELGDRKNMRRPLRTMRLGKGIAMEEEIEDQQSKGSGAENKMALWLPSLIYTSGPKMPVDVKDGVSVVLPEDGTWTDLEPAYQTAILEGENAFLWIKTVWTNVSLTRLSPSLMDLEFRGTVEAWGWVYLSQGGENAMVIELALGNAPDKLFRKAKVEVVWAACQRREMEMERIDVRVELGDRGSMRRPVRTMRFVLPRFLVDAVFGTRSRLVRICQSMMNLGLYQCARQDFFRLSVEMGTFEGNWADELVEDPMWLLGDAEARTRKEGKRFANEGWDEVSSRVVMGGWRELKPPCLRTMAWVPEFVADWFGGFEHIADVADSMREVHIECAWLTEEFLWMSLKYEPFYGDKASEVITVLRIGKYDRLEVDAKAWDAIVSREAAVAPSYVVQLEGPKNRNTAGRSEYEGCSTVTDLAEKTVVTETLALRKEGEVIDLTGRTGDKVKKGIESLHERVHGVDNKIGRMGSALLVMRAQVSRPPLPPQEAVVPPGVANRGFGRRDHANEQCKYCTAMGHYVRACPKLNHDILKRRCTRSLKGEIFGPQGEQVNWNSPRGMRRAVIMLNGLKIPIVKVEPVVDIIWEQLRGRGPQVNFILESGGRDRVNATTRLGTAGRRIIRDTVMEEVAGSSVPQAEPEAGEPDKVNGKPREEEPIDKRLMEKEEEVLQVIQERRATEGHRIPDEVADTMKIGVEGFLTEEEDRLIKRTFQEFHLAFAFSDDQKGRLDAKLIPPVRIHTVEHECWNDKGPSYEFGIAGEVTDLLRAKMDSFVAEPTASPDANRWFVFRKPNKTLRWIQDLQKLNAVTIRDAGSLPQADLLAESHADWSIYSLIDLYSGYDQLPLDVRDRPYTAMHTPVGQLQMQVTPMGFTNAVAEAQRRMLVVAGDMFPEKCEPYIDNNPIKGAQEKDETEVQPGIRRFRSRDPVEQWLQEAEDKETEGQQREREAAATARAADIADEVALLRIREANADRFREEKAAAVAALVRLRTLEDFESRMTTLEQRNEELQAKVISLEQSQLSASRPPNPRSAVIPVSQPNTTLVPRASGTAVSAGTGASSSSGSTGSYALIAVPNAGTSAQNATVLTDVQYNGPMVDKRAATLPSKYDGKADITSWISSMGSYFEVMRTPQEDRSMITGTNTEPAVRNHIELQAIAACYARIDLTDWLKVTPVRTLEDLLLDRYQDKHAALKARLKLEALKGQTWRSSMQALEQHLNGLFTTPDLGMTDVSCRDVVMGVAPKEYLSLLALKDHATWRDLMKDLVDLEAKDLARRKKAPAAGGKPQRKRFGGSNQLALHDHREADDQSYVDDLPLDNDLEPDSDTGYQNTWDKELHKVKGLYNNSIHSATGVTPNQLQYGWPMRNPLSYLFPERSPGLMPGMPGYNAKYARLLKAATAAMNKRQHAMIKHANKRRKEEKFKVGDYVWVKMSEFSDEEGISRKLLPVYYGPWQILKVRKPESNLHEEDHVCVDCGDAWTEYMEMTVQMKEKIVGRKIYTVSAAIDLLREVAPRLMKRVDRSWSMGLATNLSDPKYAENPHYWGNVLQSTYVYSQENQ